MGGPGTQTHPSFGVTMTSSEQWALVRCESSPCRVLLPWHVAAHVCGVVGHEDRLLMRGLSAFTRHPMSLPPPCEETALRLPRPWPCRLPDRGCPTSRAAGLRCFVLVPELTETLGRSSLLDKDSKLPPAGRARSAPPAAVGRGLLPPRLLFWALFFMNVCSLFSGPR